MTRENFITQFDQILSLHSIYNITTLDVVCMCLGIYFLSFAMSTIQVRIDPIIKKSTKKVLDEIGIDISSAVKIYFKQIIIHQGIPFQLLTDNGFTIQEEKEILKASQEAGLGEKIKSVKNWSQAKKHLDNLKSKK